MGNLRDGSLRAMVMEQILIQPQTETLGADKTLTVLSPSLLFLDPAGARNVDLPAEADSEGLFYLIVNEADAAELITVRNDAAGTIEAIGQGEMGMFVCNGTVWRGMVAHASGSGSVTVDDLAVPKWGSAALTIGFGAMTDVTDATGFIDFLTAVVPAGAIVLGWKAIVSTGFTGDTTAIVQVGISGDLNRFSADTAQSVLSAATVGSASLAVDTAKGMNAAVTPRVTVTGGADFTSISAGDMVLTIFWLET